MKKILIAEDDRDINNLLKDILDAEDFLTTQSFDGKDALQKLKIESFDCLLLDLMMPQVDGETVLKKLREKNIDLPIIVITAIIAPEKSAELLELGADDFITKPFRNDDVIARVKANIRRYRNFFKEEADQNLRHKNLVYEEDENRMLIKGNYIKLTPIEMEILKSLLKNPKKIFTKENLYKSAWKDDYFYEADTINVHISNLRNKLKKHDDEEYIETIWGMGYRLKN